MFKQMKQVSLYDYESHDRWTSSGTVKLPYATEDHSGETVVKDSTIWWLIITLIGSIFMLSYFMAR